MLKITNKYSNQSKVIQKTIKYFNNLYRKLGTWSNIYEINEILKLLIVSKYSTNVFFDVPVNYQKTRSRSAIKKKWIWQFKLYAFTTKFLKFKKVQVSKNFLRFDFINRLWYKQWRSEWRKIRLKRLHSQKVNYKNRININFPILEYKHIIRNFKTVNKKKQKFLSHFNLGFTFFEYIQEQLKQTRFNRNVLRKKYSKFFILKSRTQRFNTKTNY